MSGINHYSTVVTIQSKQIIYKALSEYKSVSHLLHNYFQLRKTFKIKISYNIQIACSESFYSCWEVTWKYPSPLLHLVLDLLKEWKHPYCRFCLSNPGLKIFETNLLMSQNTSQNTHLNHNEFIHTNERLLLP